MKRAPLSLAIFCAVLAFVGQAAAIPYNITYNISDAGGSFSASVNHFEGAGATNTDTISINLTGPGAVDPSGIAGTVALNISMGSTQLAGFSSFSWVWKSDDNSLNMSGTFSTTAQNAISLPFTATTPAGMPGLYHLLITSTTSGVAGGGYVYALQVDPCLNCISSPVPVPPAAILFMSALAGLGLLSRKRRKESTLS
jgi:hypothetical protein